MELSICIIVKNAAISLKKCLDSLKKLSAEIVVVDTGSKDESISIAKEYTKSVYEFAWSDDFSKAKNYAISCAKNEMVLVLDSDEWVESFDEEALNALLEQHKEEVGRIERINLLEKNGVSQENKEWINRVFSKEKYAYEGKIHEQVVSKSGKEYKTYRTGIVIKHSGYLGTKEELMKKANRNIKMLLLELEEKKDPYILYQLGKGFALLGKPEEACTYFSEALSFDLDPNLEYVIDMVEAYGYALLAAHRQEEALSFEQIEDTFGTNADFELLMGFIYMNNEQFEKAIAYFLKATTKKVERTIGAGSFLAFYNAGVVEECMGNVDKAVLFYKKCGTYPPAQERLNVLHQI